MVYNIHHEAIFCQHTRLETGFGQSQNYFMKFFPLKKLELEKVILSDVVLRRATSWGCVQNGLSRLADGSRSKVVDFTGYL